MALDFGSVILGAAVGAVGFYFVASEMHKNGSGQRQLVGGVPKYVQRVDTEADKKWLTSARDAGRKYGVDRIKYLSPGEWIDPHGLVTKDKKVIGYWAGAVPLRLPWYFDKDGQA